MTGSAAQSFIRPEDFWRNLGLRAEQTVVHLGCGPGFYLVPAAQIVGKKGRAIGVDVQANLLQETEGRAARLGLDQVVQVIRGDLERERGSTLPDGLAHWVLVANILHQADPAKILREAARVVRPDGTVVVLEWDVVATPFGPPTAARVSADQAVALAGTVGLVPPGGKREVAHPSPYHYSLRLVKEA